MQTYSASFTVDDMVVYTRSANKVLIEVSQPVRIPLNNAVVLIIGPSGCGKTTFFKALTGKCDRALRAMCRFQWHGRPMTKDDFARICHVPQDETFSGGDTPRDVVDKHRVVHCPHSTEQLTHDILRTMRMLRCADTTIGTPNQCVLSGGQKRRLSVSSTLFRECELMLMDEPASGLDDVACESLFEMIATIAAERCSVVATVHQPSEAILRASTHIMIMSEGRIEKFDETETLFHTLFATNPLRPNETRSRYLFRTLIDPREKEDEQYVPGEIKQAVNHIVDTQGPELYRGWRILYEEVRRRFRLYRSAKSIGTMLPAKAAMTIFVFWMLLYEVGEGMQALFSLRSCIFMILVFPEIALTNTINLMFPERYVFLQDWKNGSSYPLLWVLASFLVEIMIYIPLAILVGLCMSFLVNLHHDILVIAEFLTVVVSAAIFLCAYNIAFVCVSHQHATFVGMRHGLEIFVSTTVGLIRQAAEIIWPLRFFSLCNPLAYAFYHSLRILQLDYGIKDAPETTIDARLVCLGASVLVLAGGYVALKARWFIGDTEGTVDLRGPAPQKNDASYI